MGVQEVGVGWGRETTLGEDWVRVPTWTPGEDRATVLPTTLCLPCLVVVNQGWGNGKVVRLRIPSSLGVEVGRVGKGPKGLPETPQSFVRRVRDREGVVDLPMGGLSYTI